MNNLKRSCSKSDYNFIARPLYEYIPVCLVGNIYYGPIKL